MLTDLKIQVVRKKRIELDAQQTSLGQQSAVLFDSSDKMGRGIAVGKDHRFAAQSTHLGAADIKDVAALGQSWQIHVCTDSLQAVT